MKWYKLVWKQDGTKRVPVWESPITTAELRKKLGLPVYYVPRMKVRTLPPKMVLTRRLLPPKMTLHTPKKLASLPLAKMTIFPKRLTLTPINTLTMPRIAKNKPAAKTQNQNAVTKTNEMNIPQGWTQHPQNPAYAYNAAGEVKLLSELAPPLPPVPVAPPLPPAIPPAVLPPTQPVASPVAAVVNNGVNQPQAGTTSATVWAVCAALAAQLGRVPETKEVANACAQYNIPVTTANTQG